MTGIETGLAIAGIASSIAGTGGSIYAQGKSNKKTRQHAEHMYRLQTADNRYNWQMENQYNHPKLQMQRLQEAGLNPMLVYGNGQATATGGSINPSKPLGYEDKAPDIGKGIGNIQDSLMGYVGFRQAGAQTDNIIAQTENTQAQKANIQADTQIKAIEAAQKLFNYNKDQELYDTTVQSAKANLDSIVQNTEASKANVRIAQQNADANTFNAKINADNAKTNAYQAQTNRMSTNSIINRNLELNKLTRAEVKRVEEVTKTQEFDTSMKKIHAEITNMGGNPTDPGWQRALWLYASKIFGLPDNTPEKNTDREDIWEKYKSLDTNPALDSVRKAAAQFYNSK